MVVKNVKKNGEEFWQECDSIEKRNNKKTLTWPKQYPRLKFRLPLEDWALIVEGGVLHSAEIFCFSFLLFTGLGVAIAAWLCCGATLAMLLESSLEGFWYIGWERKAIGALGTLLSSICGILCKGCLEVIIKE